MAEMPEEKFEENLANVKRNVGKKKKRQRKQKDPISDRALWVWGQIKDFEEEEVFACDPNVILSEMQDTMKPDIRRVVPQLIKWLRRFKI